MVLGVSLPRIITPLLLLVFVAIRRGERRVVRLLQQEHAISPEHAVILPDPGRIMRWSLQRLAWGGAVRLTQDRRYYLDPEGYRTFTRHRRTRAAVVLSLVLVLAAIFYFFPGAFTRS